MSAARLLVLLLCVDCFLCVVALKVVEVVVVAVAGGKEVARLAARILSVANFTSKFATVLRYVLRPSETT